jgi:hypothetical protein
MSRKALEIDGQRFTNVLDGLVERVALGMTAEEGGAECVISPTRLCLEDRCISHHEKYTPFRFWPIARFNSSTRAKHSEPLSVLHSAQATIPFQSSLRWSGSSGHWCNANVVEGGDRAVVVGCVHADAGLAGGVLIVRERDDRRCFVVQAHFNAGANRGHA